MRRSFWRENCFPVFAKQQPEVWLVVLKSYLFALGTLTTRVCHNILCIQRGQQTGMTEQAEVQRRERYVTVIVSPSLFIYTL